MSSLRLILASLAYHWRMNLAVACGVAAGTAVLIGALLVGDSMRGSLRDLTLNRLGPIEEVLLPQRFFREDLARELSDQPHFKEHFSTAVPVILLQSSVRIPGEPSGPRANRVNLVGCDARFWELGPTAPRELSRKEIVLNRPLADKLGVAKGDDVILHLPDPGTVPGDSLLGKKRDTATSPRLSVAAVMPAQWLGRFSLEPNQQLPLNAYVALDGLQRRLDRPDRVNAILVAGRAGVVDPPSEYLDVLQERHLRLGSLLRPTLADYGIQVTENEPDLPEPQRHRFRYLNVTSDRMLLEPEAEAAIHRALEGEEFQPVFTYLANAIDEEKRDLIVEEQDDDGKIIPYSTITAIDFATANPLGPFLTPDGDPIEPLEANSNAIVLNSWAADDLGVEPGAKIHVTYFEPESTRGQAPERTETFELAAIVDLAGPAKDKAFTPTVEGVTDKASIDEWEAPFSPFRRKLVRAKDDAYWQEHGLTPKAFVSLATGRRLWGSRFGQTTGFRVRPGERMTAASLTKRIQRELKPAKLGFAFQPVKRQGLEASVGATSFRDLFLAFSFFLVAAAVMLVALLFRLGIDSRADQIGILLAVGLSRRKVARLLAGEGVAVAALGSLAGVAVGFGYAKLMLAGLTSEGWWLEAIGTPFLRFHVTPSTPANVLIGYTSGVLAAVAAIAWAVWRTRHTATRQLLAGQIGAESRWTAGPPRLAPRLAWGMLVGAIALSLWALALGEEAKAGAFFGAGAMVLVASLALVWSRLRAGALRAAVAIGPGNLVRMAVRSLARNPGRSTLTIGLVASASFLIVSVSAFHLDPTGQAPSRDSGNGGFALVAESDQPIYHDLNTPEGRDELGFTPDESKALEAAEHIYPLRVKPGDDATCLNLYQPRQPRMLGVSHEFVERGAFVFKAWTDLTEAETGNPWLLLERDLGRDQDGVPLVPVVLDAATATYALHLGRGKPTLDVTTDGGETIRLRVVGVLAGSIFQGDVLMSERALLEHFPETSGYRFFLVDLGKSAPDDSTQAIQNALDGALGDYGLTTETTGQRLSRFLVVQNTYLATFQSLGGLGLLLGTLGLAAVQLRAVLERRGELALLRATGFGRRALAWLVMLENGLLLLAGLGAGVLAALVAVLPHLVSGGASIPWGSLGATLILVLAVGLLAGLAAVRAVLIAPLLAALRGE